jgi:3-oxoacyl-[acyl-carrier-protein] synthase III
MNMNKKVKYPLPIKILGMGRYLPKRIIKSSELEERCGLEKGWCERKQGVRERRWVENETFAFMGAEAAREAAADAEVELSDIDLIIIAAQSFEMAVPEDGASIQNLLGLGNSGIPCIRVTSACLGFLLAMNISMSLITVKHYRNILIVSPEINSTNLDFNNPNVCTLLGDAAAAAVIGPTPGGEASAIHTVLMETYSEASELSSLSGGKKHTTFFDYNIRPRDLVFNYEPQMMQTIGMKYNQTFLAKLWPMSNKDAIKLVIPNQASRLAIDYTKFLFRPDRVMGIIDVHGHCGAAGYPIALYEAIKQKRVSRGDMIMIEGMAAGLSLMGIVLTY